MTQPPGSPAELGLTSFICPHCQAFAQQNTDQMAGRRVTRTELVAAMESWVSGEGGFDTVSDSIRAYSHTVNRRIEVVDYFFITTCAACDSPSFWGDRVLLWPTGRGGAAPNPDMPANVLELYNEARDVLHLSPRAAATLLRVALERLVDGLVAGNENLNAKIGELVRGGLSPTVQQAMDAMRVFGNDGAHAGQLDPTDTLERAVQLFDVINMVVRQVIVEPMAIATLYGQIPASKRDQVARRDGA